MIDASTAAADWLAYAHPTPETARREWTEGCIALIPTGHTFDAVRLSAALVHAVTGAVPEVVAEVAGELINGPLIHDAYDTSRWYYALVEVGACSQLQAPDACRLDEGTWLGVPRVEHTGRPGAYWVCPPRHREDWCDPKGVAELVRLGRLALGAARPDLEATEDACRALLEEPRDPDPTHDDATDAIMRARGLLMSVLPHVEIAAAHGAGPDRTRGAGRSIVGAARALLAVDASTLNTARQYAHVQRLVRYVLDGVQLLRELDELAGAQ